MSRVKDIFTSCYAELDDPALQDAECDQDERYERSRLNVIHRDAAGRGKLSAVHRRHHIGPGKRDHVDKEDEFEGVVHNLEDRLASAWENCNKLFDLDRQAFLAAVADAQKAAPDKQVSGEFLRPGQGHSKNVSA